MGELFASELFPVALSITLQGPVDLAGFRRAARRLLAQQIAPGQVSWHCSGAAVTGASSNTGAGAAECADAPAVSVPPEFLSLCQSVILHRDAGRFDLLYRLLWRLLQEPALRHDLLDADMAQAHGMAQAVRLDQHDMKALLRFRSMQDESFKTHPEGGPLHLAWFAPAHHIVEAVAPFFVQRFARMRWAILTPERSLAWDCGRTFTRHGPSACGRADVQPGGAPGALRLGSGVSRQDAPQPGASEQRWLSVYQQRFKPARQRRKTATREKPQHDRKDLAPAQSISGLAAERGQTAL